MHDTIKSSKKSRSAVVEKRLSDLRNYFHPIDLELTKRFNFIYRLFDISDIILANEVKVTRQTMNRYKRGVWIPDLDMKIKIVKSISKLADIPLDTSIVWGEDLIFNKWKDEMRSKQEVENENN